MTTLLVLGSKPDPVLPALDDIDEVACANASGRSACRLGLPRPSFTVISSVVASGKNPSNRLALAALAGLSTGTLYIYPRPPYGGRVVKMLANLPALLRTTRPMIKFILKKTGYIYEKMVSCSFESYNDTVLQLCGNDPRLAAQLRDKAPSSGVIAIALGLRDERYERVIISGFSFEITHAYADNPDIASRNSALSRHAATDIAVLARLAQCSGRIVTTEPIVHERTGVLLLPAAAHRHDRGAASAKAIEGVAG